MIWVNMIQSFSSRLEISDCSSSFVQIKYPAFKWQSTRWAKCLLCPMHGCTIACKEICKVGIKYFKGFQSQSAAQSLFIGMPVLILLDVSHFAWDPYKDWIWYTKPHINNIQWYKNCRRIAMNFRTPLTAVFSADAGKIFTTKFFDHIQPPTEACRATYSKTQLRHPRFDTRGEYETCLQTAKMVAQSFRGCSVS